MLLLLLACATEQRAVREFNPPNVPGPWVVGTAESTFDGPAGEHPVQVWYPSLEADEDLYRYDDLLEGGAREDAVADCKTTHPVVVFSHGNGGLRWQSIFLTEHLASHGFVVVSPEHVGNTFFDAEQAPLGEMALRRPVDVATAYDWVSVTEADGLLDGCIDREAGYSVVGHSFGGFTTFAVLGARMDTAASSAYCADHDEWLCDDFADAMAAAGETTLDLGDPDARAGVAMTPAGIEVLVGGLADVEKPLLVLGGSLDELTPMETQVRPLYEGLRTEPRALGTLEGAGHYAFSDACRLVTTYDDCSPPYLPDEATHPVIATVVTAFLRSVGGDERVEPWLPDPEAEILAWEASP